MTGVQTCALPISGYLMLIHGARKRGVCVVKTIGAKSEQLSPSTDSRCAAATGGYVSACPRPCTRMCSYVAGEGVTERGSLGRTGVHSSLAPSCFLQSVLHFQGSAHTQGCEQNVNDNLEKSHSSDFCLDRKSTRLNSSH